MSITLLFLSAFALIFSVLCVHSFLIAKWTRRQLPLPPGPTPLPIIGNLLDLPTKSPWLVYRDLCKKYGPLICLRAMGHTIVVVGDAQTAIDLVDKRSATYADRPELPMVKLTGWDWSFVFERYGQKWRERRRAFWQHFRPDAIPQYSTFQQQAIHRLLSRLLVSPENFKEHLRYSLGGLMLNMTYGLKIAEKDDEKIVVFEKAFEGVEYLISGSSLLENLPLLRHLPRWLPGSQLGKLEEIRNAALQVRDSPWALAKEAEQCEPTAAGQESIAQSMSARISRYPSQSADAAEIVAKDAAGVVYAAGLDTQYATLQRFFLAMSLYPEVQKKAQAELDAVVGSSRLPALSDREELHYVNALLKETFRWYPVLPMGIAHSALADDEYDGYLIPRETTVLVNIWAIANDPNLYPSPETFNPERYLKHGRPNPEVKDPSTVIFGSGRRLCPGRYFAESALFLFMTNILHVFDISPAMDEKGRRIHVQPRQTTGVISYLEDCRCAIVPRSLERQNLVPM